MKRVAIFVLVMVVVAIIVAVFFWVAEENARQKAIVEKQQYDELANRMRSQPLKFFKIRWGMSIEEVKSILEDIKPQVKNKTVINSKLDTDSFNQIDFSGKTIQDQNIIYHICGDKKTQFVFRFEFENNNLVAIYIKSHPKYMEYYDVPKLLESYDVDYFCGMPNKKLMEFNLTRCGDVYYIAYPKASNIPYAIWNASTNMTIERLIEVNSSFEKNFSYSKTSEILFNSDEKTYGITHSNPSNVLDKNRVELYQRNVLELLN